ncbi:MAG TPA: ABC transporter ATP-binding protein [Alphaproteobacteria bacterium]|nr:ABC transporter ATP-binding protein [Alphaproteobacteria bacterium]
MLAIEGLTQRFGGLEALAGIDYAVGGEGVFGLIGPNGSGKTTLFNVITGLYRPSAGRVVFMGEDISRRAPHQIIAKGIARTFQTPRIYARMTVRENLAAAQHTLSRGARSAEDGPSIDALLEATGLADRRDELAKSLPLPEQRRLELARALARAPKLLLLDEPAGGMTPKETQAMAQLIEEVAAPGRACVIIEHKMDMIARLCANVCVLNFGSKIAEGPPEAVLKDPAVLEAYIGRDAGAA